MVLAQTSLFDGEEEAEQSSAWIERTNRVRGLSYLEEFISIAQEQELLVQVDAAPWSCELSRRVQHYGFKYDYKSRKINANMSVGELPEWLSTVAERLRASGVFSTVPDQVIVNEYLPGQGITPHIDCTPCFGNTIASLSLHSPCVMQFSEPASAESVDVLLERRSVVVLKEDARFAWRHAIAKRRVDVYAGNQIVRSRRVSLTFRTVILEA